MLVEDSEPSIVQIKDILEDIGYLMLVAHDGGEALGIIAQTIPDAMILDLMMPGIDGFTSAKNHPGSRINNPSPRAYSYRQKYHKRRT